MAATNKRIDAIRRLILGPLYSECKDNPMGVKREDLEARFEEIKNEGCIGNECGFDEIVRLCQLKNHYPTCLSDNRDCVENMGERSTGIKKFYYDQYKRAKEIEDEPDDEDEEEEIECPSCLMNENDDIRLVETVTNPRTEQGPLSCGHLVHKSCLIRTAINKGRDVAECPLCNKEFSLLEVEVPVRDRNTRERDNIRRAVLHGTQMNRSFAEIADVYGYTPEELLERIDMDERQASEYYSIPIDQILVPVNRRLDFESDAESEDESEVNVEDEIIRNIGLGDIQEAIRITLQKIREEGNNEWVSSDIILEILESILNLDRRRDLDLALALFIMSYHPNIIRDDEDETIADAILRMFRASTTKRGIAKLILLNIIKKDSIGMYYILKNFLKDYDRVTPSTENEVIAFIFEAYNRSTESNEPVAEIGNETDGNTVLKGFLNDILEEIHNWNNSRTTDILDLIREWFDEHYPGEFEREDESEDEDENFYPYEMRIVNALNERNYDRALELIVEKNEGGGIWLTSALFSHFFSKMKEQTDATNKDVLTDIFKELMREPFYDLISEELNAMYVSGIEAQKDIAIECLKLLITYNYSLTYKVIESSLRESYLEFCRGIFELYNTIRNEVAQPPERQNMSAREVVEFIIENLLDDQVSMSRLMEMGLL